MNRLQRIKKKFLVFREFDTLMLVVYVTYSLKLDKLKEETKHLLIKLVL